MWKDDYISGMHKRTANATWRVETLRRMESAAGAAPQVLSVGRAGVLAGCAAALALVVITAWPGLVESPQTAGGAQSSAAVAQEQESAAGQTAAPRQNVSQDAAVSADSPSVQGTVLRCTDRELVLSTDDGERIFLLGADSEVDPNALDVGAVVQILWESAEDGAQYAVQVRLMS